MLTAPSPYHRVAASLRDQGYHVMPVAPGTKVPGEYRGEWRPMSGWQRHCDTMPVEIAHERWEAWPDAGVCVAHGAIIGLDLDTDRRDVETALHSAVEVPNVRKRGAKGWTGYYRPGPGLDGLTARVRWYDPAIKGADGEPSQHPVVELLLHGTQSVLPPTIHPDTGQPYRWVTPDTLETVALEDLPEFTGRDLAALDREFGKLGLTRQAPRRVRAADFERPAATDHDLEKPWGRSVNDRAMEAIDAWWPALDMPKSRQRGPGAWEAVPFWRGSSSGRAVVERNPNLRATPQGIVDFGADRSYTPLDLVMAARDCSVDAAGEWLSQFIRPEVGAEIAPSIAAAPPTADVEIVRPIAPDTWAAMPVLAGARSFGKITPVRMPSDAEWEAHVPKKAPPFPIQDFGAIEGLLGACAQHLDNASTTWTEAGALAVTLPLLGAAMGRAYETPTRLRTNVYSVAIGGSGSGKTSLVNPAKELMTLSGLQDLIGNDRIASGSGLIKMLTGHPRRVVFLDEFGHMLQQIGSAGAGIHVKQIITEFTQLYSAANTLFTGTAYATQEPAPIECPHLCIFGMATPDQFWRAFGSSSLEDGSIARYLVFPLGQTGDKAPDSSAGEAVAEMLRYLSRAISGRVTGNLGNAEMRRVPLDEYAEAGRADLKRKETSFAEYAERNGVRGGPAILRRVTENALKIALISAVGRDAVNPEIDARDMDIGHALAWWSACVMISNIASHIADNQLERDVNEVERKIRDAGPDGIMKGLLKDRCRGIGKRAFDEIIEGLEEAGRIAKMRTASTTKIGWKLVHRGVE